MSMSEHIINSHDEVMGELWEGTVLDRSCRTAVRNVPFGASLPRRAALASVIGVALGAPAVRAQSWPARPVRVVIPFAPGGGADAVARPLMERLQKRFGVAFIADNRGGAGTAIGTAAVATAAPDGYTLLYATSSFLTAAILQPHLFDPVGAFDPVAVVARAPLAVAVAANSPIRTVADLIRAGRQNPDGMFYGTAGVGTYTHFASEMFNLRAGTRMQHVPYRGMGPAVIALLAGDVQFYISTPASAGSQIRNGQVRIVAYTAPGRAPGTPDAPLVQETLPDYYDANVWSGFLAPKGTPREIRVAINEAMSAVAREPEIAEIYHAQGSVPTAMDVDAFARMIETDLASAREVAEAAGIRPD